MADRPDVDLRGHDLNLFVVFVALMREQSVSIAARTLNMSQSAVSAALGRLRAAHGDQLFTRTHGGITPTLRAKRMYGPVLAALSALEVAVGGEQLFDPHHDRFAGPRSCRCEHVQHPDLVAGQPRSRPLSRPALLSARLLPDCKDRSRAAASFTLGGMFALIVAVVLAGLPLYVFPPQGEAADADLIYVIGPPTAPRMDLAE